MERWWLLFDTRLIVLKTDHLDENGHNGNIVGKGNHVGVFCHSMLGINQDRKGKISDVGGLIHRFKPNGSVNDVVLGN